MKKVLVVVDMQKDFIDGALGTKEAVGIVERAAKEIAQFEGRIFVTMDTHHEDYLLSLIHKSEPTRRRGISYALFGL